VSVGTVYTIMPIPPEPAMTTYIQAGVVTIGVELRRVDDQLVGDFFKDVTPEQQAEIDANKPADLDDGGVSIHVCSTEGLDEYLRFDCFTADPHYHYVMLEEARQEVIKYDAVANGDMLMWALDRVANRLPEMLTRAGAVALAKAIDPAAIQQAVPLVQRACVAAEKA
jgi:hypothetical protein